MTDIEILIADYVDKIAELEKENGQLKQQIEKMKSFIYSEIDFCMYCPLTKDCKNDEGTCPFANITEEEQKNLLSDWITK